MPKLFLTCFFPRSLSALYVQVSVTVIIHYIGLHFKQLIEKFSIFTEVLYLRKSLRCI